MDIIEALAVFDGKRVAPLREAVAGFNAAEADVLVTACSGKDAVAATWMIKALLESGKVAPLDMAEVFAALQDDLPWESQLHLLQSVQHAPDAALPQVMFIRDRLNAKRTLLRVWALDAFVRLALVEPGFLPEAQRLVTEALVGKAASMQARARKLGALLADVNFAPVPAPQ